MKYFLMLVLVSFFSLRLTADPIIPEPENETQMMMMSGETCSSSAWCASSFDHCLRGICQMKNAFNRCLSGFDCAMVDHCSDGVCVPN